MVKRNRFGKIKGNNCLVILFKLFFVAIPKYLLQTLAFYEFILCSMIALSYSAYQILHLGEYTNETRIALDIIWLFIIVYSFIHVIRIKKDDVNKKKNDIITIFISSCFKCVLAFFPLWGLFLIIEPDKIIENYAMRNSHTQIGVVYRKYSNWSYSKTMHEIHHLSIGISSSQTKDHWLQKEKEVAIFESMHVGDTVILCVSDKYPRVNRVLNWQPTHDEIEKYKTPVKLVERKCE